METFEAENIPDRSIIHKRMQKIRLESEDKRNWFVDGDKKQEIVHLAVGSTGIKSTSRDGSIRECDISRMIP